MSDVSQPDFWNARYLEKTTRWDQGGPAPMLKVWEQERAYPRGRIGVIGAGKGHDAFYLANAGHTVTALDFAPEAVAEMSDRRDREGVKLEVVQADLFTYPAEAAGTYAGIFEHTCFCAIDVHRRGEYVDAVHALLQPGGALFGLFWAHSRPGGPPFGTSETEIRELFGPKFSLDVLRPARESFKERAGEELEFWFRKR
jgi:SAM-dependent methyltransferase